ASDISARPRGVFGRFVPRVEVNHEQGDSVGREGSLSSVKAFVPVYESADNDQLAFIDARALMRDSSTTTAGANLGAGYRSYDEYLNRTFGGYAFYDYLDTGRAFFNQVSGGVETLGEYFDARANFYAVVGKDRRQ